MDWPQIPQPQTINAWLTLGGTLLGLVLWVGRRTIMVVLRDVRLFLRGLNLMVGQFPGLVRDVSYVKREVQFNGGSSSKDMLRRVGHCIDYLMADADVGTFSTDHTGRILRVSDVVCETLQTQRESLLGFGWRSFIPQSDYADVSRRIESIVSDGRNARLERVTIVSERTTHVVNVDMVALRGVDGEFTGHLCFARCTDTAHDQSRDHEHD